MNKLQIKKINPTALTIGSYRSSHTLEVKCFGQLLNSNDMAVTNTNEDNDGKVEIFCRYIIRNGKKIYPKNRQFFHFWVKKKK